MDRRSESENQCPLKIKECPIEEELSRLREECQKLRELSQVDTLTGFFNYRFLLAALEKEMERSRRMGLCTGLVMIDLDGFKRVNDDFGHESGNRALEWCAGIWRETMRRIDIPCRYGGEEFVFILPGTRLRQSVQVAERLRFSLENSPLELEGRTVRLTASFGVDVYEGRDDLTVKEFIAKADRYLLESKEGGRNMVSYDKSQMIVTPTEITDQERDALYKRTRPRG
ncbi:MAG: diguanylate cyclase [Pseudomonadota bacterium]